MSDSNARSTSGTAGSPPAMQRRRGSSIAGQTFQDLYEAARSRQASDSAQSAASPTLPSGSISSAFQAHRRRLSLTTVGLGNTANSGSPAFSGFGAHRDSNTSTSTTSIDEQAIDDDCGSSVSQPQSGGNVQQLPQNNTPFGRRMSFGARALRDAKTGPATSRPMNGRSSLSSPVQQHILPAATTTAPSPDTGGLKPSYSGRGGSSCPVVLVPSVCAMIVHD